MTQIVKLTLNLDCLVYSPMRRAFFNIESWKKPLPAKKEERKRRESEERRILFLSLFLLQCVVCF